MKRFVAILATFVTLAPCSGRRGAADTKVPRIGYLTGATPDANRPASRRSARACASLVTWRGKILSLSIDSEVPARSQPS